MKSKTTAGLLALFLGGLGLHKFYLGRWGWGIIYLVLCFTFIPAIVGFFEGIVLLSMNEQKFQEKYSAGILAITPEGIATPDTHVRCPDCRELVRRDAKKCKHCGTGLIPQ